MLFLQVAFLGVEGDGDVDLTLGNRGFTSSAIESFTLNDGNGLFCSEVLFSNLQVDIIVEDLYRIGLQVDTNRCA